ncbi:MAG: hypothetical protein ACON47_09045 [Flavobacteriaceae bacterium]
MKKYSLLGLLILLLSCQSEDCITIEDKQTVNGNFYFLFGAQNDFANNTNNNSLFIPDTQQSGEVSEAVFKQYQIGDTYCY